MLDTVVLKLKQASSFCAIPILSPERHQGRGIVVTEGRLLVRIQPGPLTQEYFSVLPIGLRGNKIVLWVALVFLLLKFLL